MIVTALLKRHLLASSRSAITGQLIFHTDRFISLEFFIFSLFEGLMGALNDYSGIFINEFFFPKR